MKLSDLKVGMILNSSGNSQFRYLVKDVSTKYFWIEPVAINGATPWGLNEYKETILDAFSEYVPPPPKPVSKKYALVWVLGQGENKGKYVAQLRPENYPVIAGELSRVIVDLTEK